MLYVSTHKIGISVRLVMVGTLDSDDLPSWNEAFTAVGFRDAEIRLVVTRLWQADENALHVIRHQVSQMRQLGTRCLWSGADKNLTIQLQRVGERAYIRIPDGNDLKAADNWVSKI
ncbi:MAG: hypothetical protein JWM76_1844 [Pseudonocardiales bacterium]|jgi:anti-anti-sigma regulatory factor|nr:hypothetical protein [Pseudonocardiales bacterium]